MRGGGAVIGREFHILTLRCMDPYLAHLIDFWSSEIKIGVHLIDLQWVFNLGFVVIFLIEPKSRVVERRGRMMVVLLTGQQSRDAGMISIAVPKSRRNITNIIQANNYDKSTSNYFIMKLEN